MRSSGLWVLGLVLSAQLTATPGKPCSDTVSDYAFGTFEAAVQDFCKLFPSHPHTPEQVIRHWKNIPAEKRTAEKIFEVLSRMFEGVPVEIDKVSDFMTRATRYRQLVMDNLRQTPEPPSAPALSDFRWWGRRAAFNAQRRETLQRIASMTFQTHGLAALISVARNEKWRSKQEREKQPSEGSDGR